MMTYTELYAQYESCIEIQNKIISKCREDYMAAIKKGNHNKSEALGRILKTYYDERNDLVTSANEMKKYVEAENQTDMVS